MRGVPVPVWNIQGSDYYHQQLTRIARWNGVEWMPNAVPAAENMPTSL